MSDPYGWWRDALAGQDMSKRFHDGQLEAGFYRMRFKNRQTGAITWAPVAVYPSDNGLVCQIGANLVAREDATERWTYFGRFPVKEEHWRAVAERKEPWFDQDKIVAEQTRGMGDNRPPEDPDQELIDQIAAASLGIESYKRIASDDDLAKSQSLRARIMELIGLAEKRRKAQKQPFLDGGRAVDKKWGEPIEGGEKAAKALKKINDSYLTLKLQAQRAVEAASADSMEPETAPIMPTQVRGAYGRAASVKPEWTLKEITDWNALIEHFKDSAAVRECIEELARKAIKAGEEIPGTVREERAVTR